MLQLNPMIPFETPDGKAFTAFAIIDYSQEHEVLFLGWYEESREVWVVSQRNLRAATNTTMGRLPKGK